MVSIEQVNIVSAEFKANPFPFLATLRAPLSLLPHYFAGQS